MEQVDKEKKKIYSGVGFSISDVPLGLMKWWMEDIKTSYNDCYWAKLMDLRRKAEAYDAIMSLSGQPVEGEVEELPTDVDEADAEVSTIGSQKEQKKDEEGEKGNV